MRSSILCPEFESFQKRFRSGELKSPELNDENRERFRLPVQIRREAITADRICGISREDWDRQVIERRQTRLL